MANPSVKGTANAANGTSVTIPTHAVGDVIVLWIYRDGSTTAPTKPAASGTVPAWVDIDTGTGTATNGGRTAYFVATATNHTSGTWTNSSAMVAVVIQNQASSLLGGHARGGGTAANSATAPAITQSQTTGKSLLLYFYGHRTVTAWSAAPTGFTRQASTTNNVCFNTKDSSTSDGSQAQTNTAASSGYYAATVEILGTETSPSVSLSSPADAATVTDTTPDLTFTGTDSEGDDVRYNVQVATNSAFVKTITVGTSYNGQITDGTPSVTVSTLSTTSKFIAFAGNHQGTITAVTLNGTNMTKMATAATAFNETAEIWYIDNPGALTNVTLTGTFSGGSGRSLSAICLENTKDGVEDVEATNTGSDSGPTVNITPTSEGSIVLASAYAEDNFTQGAGETNISILESDTYECAAASYDIQTTIETQAMNFSIGSEQRWAICAVAIAPADYLVANKVSGTDAGFSGSPDNSDPFASGQDVTYTVQSALSDTTTYYWRVRGIDPSGSNTYGDWATTRSFYLNTAGGGTVVQDIIGGFGFIPFAR